MHAPLPLFLSFLLGLGVVGCTNHIRQNVESTEFAKLGEEFKAKAGRDRRVEGERIQTLLPKCPVTWEKDIGTGYLVAYDYSHPSYRLTKQELFQRLGQPAGSYDGTVLYDLVRDSNRMIWRLSIQLQGNYVVDSRIYGTLESSK